MRLGQAEVVRGGWDRRRLAAVAAGGALGASLRWFALSLIETNGFPWGVLAVNLLGALLLGILLAEEWTHPAARLWLHDLGGIGFCGGLTTFSTFSLDVVELARRGETTLAMAYTLASVLGAIVAITLGAAGFRRVRALTIPLEEAP